MVVLASELMVKCRHVSASLNSLSTACTVAHVQYRIIIFFFRLVATIKEQIILPLFSACWVFSCFRNLSNSNMDYRIFNVRTWSFLGTPTASQRNIFYSEKLIKFFLHSWHDSNSVHGMWSLLPIEPPHHPFYYIKLKLWWHENTHIPHKKYHNINN